MAKAKRVKQSDPLEKAVELTQESAKAGLDATVRTVELAEVCVQGVYEAGYKANVDGLKIAKNYWDAASEIRNDWIKLFSDTGERLIDGATKIELPFQDRISDLGKSVYENVEHTFDNLTAKAKPAAK